MVQQSAEKTAPLPRVGDRTDHVGELAKLVHHRPIELLCEDDVEGLVVAIQCGDAVGGIAVCRCRGFHVHGLHASAPEVRAAHPVERTIFSWIPPNGIDVVDGKGHGLSRERRRKQREPFEDLTSAARRSVLRGLSVLC